MNKSILVPISRIFTILGIVLIFLSLIPLPKINYVNKTITLTTYTYRQLRKIILNETFVLPPGHAKAYCFRFYRPLTLHILIEVLNGGNRDINFWVMNKADWSSFIHGEPFYYYVVPSRERITSATITWSPPINKDICFVYDNTFSVVSSKTIHTMIIAVYSAYTTYTTFKKVVQPQIMLHNISDLLAPGIVLLVIGVTMGAISRNYGSH